MALHPTVVIQQSDTLRVEQIIIIIIIRTISIIICLIIRPGKHNAEQPSRWAKSPSVSSQRMLTSTVSFDEKAALH